eukprot:TRINITY_DN8115_c0_g4_i1.p2 TRINITY_DN8115_c0_g4~~TRINITY_DN8115_c0_g4_i1.p2  ORF type:complete len:167 (+),score=6.36 TRINITY_DN8115_c0_g4_i1:238-738(+)
MDFSSKVKTSRCDALSGNPVGCPSPFSRKTPKEKKKSSLSTSAQVKFLNRKSRKLKKNSKKARGRRAQGRKQGGRYKTWGHILARPRAPHNTTRFIIEHMECSHFKESLDVCGSMIGLVNLAEIEKQEATCNAMCTLACDCRCRQRQWIALTSQCIPKPNHVDPID